MEQIRQHFANVGEWSELYVLGYLLSKGGAHAADSNQSAIENVFYEVLNVQLTSKDLEVLRYEISEDLIKVYNTEGLIKAITRSEIDNALARLLEDLSADTNTKTFTIQSGNYLAGMLERKQVSAGSQSRTFDLEIVLKDPDNSVVRPKVGFSIKSQLGSPASLLNASGATNFIYRISEVDAKESLSQIDVTTGSIVSKISRLYESGFQLEFIGLDSEVFESNLAKIDSFMAQNLAQLLLTFYRTNANKFTDVAELTFPTPSQTNAQRIYKSKELLGAIAMGMRPSIPWDGDSSKFKGLIVAKARGEVVIYYLFNLPDFQEFLYKSVRFERGSTKRHKYGEIYSNGNDYFIKLNLQIRFIK